MMCDDQGINVYLDDQGIMWMIKRSSFSFPVWEDVPRVLFTSELTKCVLSDEAFRNNTVINNFKTH